MTAPITSKDHALRPLAPAAEDWDRPICGAARNCYLWAKWLACWTQRCNSKRKKWAKVEKPVCDRHARTFAESHGLTMKEGA